MYKKKSIFPLFVLIIFVNSVFLFAASEKITGIVIDSKTKEPLPGANVVVKGTLTGSSTDSDGFFFIPDIEPGNYTLLITYVGYKDKEIAIEVKAGESPKLKIELDYVAMESDQAIIVTAQAEGQIKAINQQLSSKAIKNVVSEARIKELPDANAAEALGRLPGVTINRSGGEANSVNIRGQSGGANSFYVEGMRLIGSEGRGVELSNISSSMIGGIELQKSYLPDNDGDVSGGAVVFKMKEADPGLMVDVLARQGYNGLTESFLMNDISVTLGNRFFDDRLGAIVNLTYDKKDRSSDQVSGEYTSYPISTDDLPGVEPFSGTFSRRVEIHNRWGVTYNIDYKTSDHKIRFMGFLASLERDGSQTTNEILRTPKKMLYSGMKYLSKDNSYLFGLNGDHSLWKMKLDWGASYSSTKREQPGIYGINGENVFKFKWDRNANIVDLFASVADQHDFRAINTTATSFSSTLNKASETSFYLNAELPFNISNLIAGQIKMGGKFRRDVRSYNKTGSEVWYAANPTLYGVEGTALIDSLYPELNYFRTDRNIIGYGNFAKDKVIGFKAGKNMNLYYPVDWDLTMDVIERCKNEYRRNLALKANNYNNSENISAGYIMANIDFGPYVSFIPGVRFESYIGKTDAYKYVADPSRIGTKIPGDITPVQATTINDEWLPMFTLKVKPLDWFDIRASVTKTLLRPSFQSMSPRLSEDTEFNRDYGNPLLKPAKSQNYDLYLSFYESYLGLFTVGGFYKNIVDEINSINDIIIDPDSLGLPDKYKFKTFSTFENNKYYSFIKGLELDWQTNLWYLPYFLNGLVLNVNYTLLGTESKRRLLFIRERQIPVYPFRETILVDSSRISNVLESPNQTLKLSLGYEKGGFSGRVSLFYQARALSWVAPYKNDNEATEQIYRWDVQLSQRIIDGLKLYVNGNNLSAWPDVTSFYYFPDKKTYIENYGWSMNIGLRYQL